MQREMGRMILRCSPKMANEVVLGEVTNGVKVFLKELDMEEVWTKNNDRGGNKELEVHNKRQN